MTAAPSPSETTAETAAERTACAACGEELVAGARFCEACGASVADPTAAPAIGAAAAATPAVPCEKCGAEVAADGYCLSCGHRSSEPVSVDDRGSMAFATHRGKRHHRNEDAGALAATSEGWPVLVVVDGVSASPNPHLAAAAASTAAAARLGGRPFTGPDDLVAAVTDAHAAASEVSGDGDPSWPADGSAPACTIVVGVVAADAVHLANIGDARGYVLRPGEEGWAATALTVDDSVAARAVADGVDPAAALALPDGHAITAWLGRDAPTPAPHVHTEPVATGDVVLLCSDGLWNYAPTDADLGQVVTTVVGPTIPDVLGPACEQLVEWAIEQGGADNICVAITRASGGTSD